MAWIWPQAPVVLAIHDAQLAEHGGAVGLRDQGRLDAALARPAAKSAYDNSADVADIAACYAEGIIRNHPFVDGNKRTAFVVMELFLLLNGWRLEADDHACVTTFNDLAAGKLTEPQLAHWLRQQVFRQAD